MHLILRFCCIVLLYAQVSLLNQEVIVERIQSAIESKLRNSNESRTFQEQVLSTNVTFQLDFTYMFGLSYFLYWHKILTPEESYFMNFLIYIQVILMWNYFRRLWFMYSKYEHTVHILLLIDTNFYLIFPFLFPPFSPFLRQRVDPSAISISISKDTPNHPSSSGMLNLFSSLPCTYLECVGLLLTFVCYWALLLKSFTFMCKLYRNKITKSSCAQNGTYRFPGSCRKVACILAS